MQDENDRTHWHNEDTKESQSDDSSTMSHEDIVTLETNPAARAAEGASSAGQQADALAIEAAAMLDILFSACPEHQCDALRDSMVAYLEDGVGERRDGDLQEQLLKAWGRFYTPDSSRAEHLCADTAPAGGEPPLAKSVSGKRTSSFLVRTKSTSDVSAKPRLKAVVTALYTKRSRNSLDSPAERRRVGVLGRHVTKCPSGSVVPKGISNQLSGKSTALQEKVRDALQMQEEKDFRQTPFRRCFKCSFSSEELAAEKRRKRISTVQSLEDSSSEKRASIKRRPAELNDISSEMLDGGC